MFVSSAILFNHDSPRRSEEYLLHKICASCVRIARGQQQSLALGNLDLRVDIGSAPEFMEAAVRMLQLPTPDDFVIGTGEAWDIRRMVQYGIDWCSTNFGMNHFEFKVEHDPKFYRPGKQTELRADISKARAAFGFNPRTKLFRQMDGSEGLMDILLRYYSGASK